MNEPEDKVIVQVRLEERDIRRANLWFAFRRKVTTGGVIFYLLAAIVTFLADRALGLEMSYLPTIFFFGAILIFLITPLIAWIQTRRIFSDLKDFQKTHTFTFSEMGFETSSEKSRGQTSWENILKVAESKHSFNLFIQRNFFLVVPKRFIGSSAELKRLREILKKNLGDKAKLQADI